jgi:hypothetical protein
MIVFLVVGITEVQVLYYFIKSYLHAIQNVPDLDLTVTAPAFLPVYCLLSEVDISSLALTGMKQSGDDADRSLCGKTHTK